MLHELSEHYGRSQDELLSQFMELNCSFTDLKKSLNTKKDKTKWKTGQDMILMKGPGSKDYDLVVKEKGEEAVLERKRFLEIN
jgi:hypothetical protein